MVQYAFISWAIDFGALQGPVFFQNYSCDKPKFLLIYYLTPISSFYARVCQWRDVKTPFVVRDLRPLRKYSN